MSLTGTYTRSLDDTQRFAVPKRLRDQFGKGKINSLFVTPETEKSLGLYSPEAFEELARRLADQPTNRVKKQNFLRMFYSRAEEVSLDSQGRVRVPERLVEFASIQSDIVLIGVHDHAEIWDSKVWDQFLKQHQEDYDQLATMAFET